MTEKVSREVAIKIREITDKIHAVITEQDYDPKLVLLAVGLIAKLILENVLDGDPMSREVFDDVLNNPRTVWERAKQGETLN